MYYTKRTNSTGDHLILSCASVVMLVGASMMIGWLFNMEPFIRLHPNFPLTNFNTALLLFLGGLGILSALKNWVPLTYFCGIFSFLVGFLTILQYKIGWNFGIDQLFMNDYLESQATTPGRIGIYSAYCFTAGGLALIIAHSFPNSPKKQISTRLLGTVILALANVALFGNIMGTEILNEWVEFSRMEPHLTPIFQIYSLGIIGYGWVYCGQEKEGLPPFLALPAAFGVLIGTFFLWHALKSSEMLQFYQVEKSEAINISSSIQNHLHRDVDAIRRIGQRWEVRGGMPRDEWEADAKEYHRDVAGLRSIHWVNENFRLAWSVPPLDSSFPINPLKIELEDLQQTAMEDARDLDSMMITKVIEGKGEKNFLFLVLSPLVYDNQFDGWIVGVFNLKELVENIIPQSILKDYHISIRDGTRVIYDNNQPQIEGTGLLAASVPLRFSNMNWNIYVHSTPETFEEQRSIFPTFNLVVGIIMSLFVGLSVYFAQKTYLRSQDLEKAIDELQESKNQMEVILHSIVEGILGLDNEGKTLFINPSGAAMFSYEPSEIEGKSLVASSVSKPYDPNFSRNIIPVINAIRRGELEETNEGTFLRKDGSNFPAEYTVSPIYGGKDKQGTVIVFRDITYRKQVEAEIHKTQQRFKSIIDNADSIIYVKDLSGHYKIVNRKFLDVFHLREKNIIGKTDAAIFPKEISETLIKNDMEVIRTKKAIQFEELIPQEDGDHTYISVKVPLYDSDERLYGISCIATDITDRKRTELQMQNYLKQIENTNIQLAEARITAEQANIAKSAFLANMSHELRTPLNGVIGTTSLLMSMSLDDKQKKYVNLIHLSGNMLLEIINDILDFSKIEAGKLNLEKIPCHLSHIIEEIVQIMTNRASDKDLSIRYEIDPRVPHTVISDPTRIRQILTNLTGNAIKFTEKGTITLSLRAEEVNEDSATILFQVKDTGIGISPQVLPQLFQKFTQADESTTRKFGGTGLGLAICRQLVELMNGKIGVDSELEKGSTFWFKITFPLAKSETPKK